MIGGDVVVINCRKGEIQVLRHADKHLKYSLLVDGVCSVVEFDDHEDMSDYVAINLD